ncbi:MAG: hypothetical protein RMK62_00805 [Armatimonadota bacterium]|nr:hypothetical protein [Armatimonadota bacterium]
MEYFVLKQHAVAAYLRLVEDCDRVLYDCEWWGAKEPPIDIVGLRRGDRAVAVDIVEKFQGYPRQIRPSTWKRKLIHRFVTIEERLRSWGYKDLRAEMWFFAPPPEVFELVLPSVQEIISRETSLRIVIIRSAEVSQRLQKTVEAARAFGKDFGNPFVQSFLLLDDPTRQPLKDSAPIPTKFPVELPDANAIPPFLDTFLRSKYIFDELGFDLESSADLSELARSQKSSVWWELQRLLNPEDDAWDDWDEEVETTRYSAQRIVRIVWWLIHNAARVLDAWHQKSRTPLTVEIGYLLPYLSRNPHFPPEIVEAEIARYGGDRDIARRHFQTPHPDKRNHRGYVHITFSGPYDPEPAPTRLPSLQVPIKSPFLPRGVTVSLSLLYPLEFAGYFFLTFNAIAQMIRPHLERSRDMGV